jgi:hypothetical protein
MRMLVLRLVGRSCRINSGHGFRVQAVEVVMWGEVNWVSFRRSRPPVLWQSKASPEPYGHRDRAEHPNPRLGHFIIIQLFVYVTTSLAFLILFVVAHLDIVHRHHTPHFHPHPAVTFSLEVHANLQHAFDRPPGSLDIDLFPACTRSLVSPFFGNLPLHISRRKTPVRHQRVSVSPLLSLSRYLRSLGLRFSLVDLEEQTADALQRRDEGC